jgi:signal transduction histidine kinase
MEPGETMPADSAFERTAEELEALADAGERAGPLAHEVNNFLNVLLLHLAVIEHTVPAERRPDLAEVRRQGKQLAELVRQWQRSRLVPAETAQSIDLNRLLEKLLKRVETPEIRIQFEGAPALPAVRGALADLHRLCSFLIENAVEVSRQGQALVRIKTEPGKAGAVRLRIEDTGPAVPPDWVPHLLEPLFTGRSGTDRLGLAACRTIVRRLNGTIEAESSPTGGVAVSVELPVA